MTMKQWMGEPPEKCDVCGNKLGKFFVDGRTITGPWAIMCAPCHRRFGAGIGPGCGQKYDTVTLVKLEG